MGSQKPRLILSAFRRQKKRAGDGNRTHVSSLEGWCSTIELHPHNFANMNSIGVTGFEPATSWSQTRRSSQAEPHPVTVKRAKVFYNNALSLSIFFSYFPKILGLFLLEQTLMG